MRQRAKILLTVVILMITIGAGLSGSVLASDSERFDPVDLAAVTPGTLTLKQSVDEVNWDDTIGDLTLGYSVALDPLYDYYYLDIKNLDASPALADGNHEFYFDAFRAPDGFWTYWADKGVDGTEPYDEPWMPIMWEIINGNQPMFYLNVVGETVTTYKLIDGLQYLQSEGAVEEPLRVNGDYPLGTYHFGGWVTDTSTPPVSEYLNIQMTFTKEATVSLEIEETDTWTIDGCGYLDVYIHLANVHDLYAVDISLSFDPAVLEVVDMLPDDPGTTEIEGEPGINLLPVDDWFVAGYWVANEADNGSGTIQYTAAQLNTTLPANADGDIAMIRFRAKSVGSGDITVIGAELSDRDGYLVGRPVNYAVPAATISTGFPSAALALDIIRLNPSTVQLSWPAQTLDDGVEYNLYRSPLPYFDIGDTGVSEMSDTAFMESEGTVSYDDAVLGDVSDAGYFYAYGLQIVCSTGFTSPLSEQVGKIEYELFETNTRDYSWVGLALENDTVVTSQDLANDIEDHIYSGTVKVSTVSRWNANGQIFTTYVHTEIGSGDIDVFVNQPYRIEVDIEGETSDSVIWAQVGRLPEITQDTYTLFETATTSFNWILQPLDRFHITNITEFAEEVESTSSDTVSVLTIGRWNGNGQTISNYVPPSDSLTRFGYPYRIEIDSLNGDPVTWP